MDNAKFYRRCWQLAVQIAQDQSKRAGRYRLAWLSARRRANRLQKIVDDLSAPRIYVRWNEETESLERIEPTETS